MRERKIHMSVFANHPLIIFCVLFALNIMATAVLLMFSSELYHLSLQNIIDSAVLCAAPVLTIVIFKHVPVLKYFYNDYRSLWIFLLVHYLFSSGLLMLLVFVCGLFLTLHPGIYRYMIIAYTQGYVVVVLTAIIIDVCKISAANKNLRKIQARKRNAIKDKDGGISNEKNN